MNFKNIAKKWGKIALCGAIVTGTMATTLFGSNKNQVANAIFINNTEYSGAKDVDLSGQCMDTTMDDTNFKSYSIGDRYERKTEYVEDYDDYVTTDYYYINAGNRVLRFVVDLADTNNTNIYIKVKFEYKTTSGASRSVVLYNEVVSDGLAVAIPFQTPSDFSETGLSKLVISGERTGKYEMKDWDFHVVAKNLTLGDSDTQAPVINGWEGVYYVNYDNPPTLSSIISKISAIDETDGNVSIKVDSDGYTGKTGTLGSHIVKLSATDSAGNKSQITIDIRVTDGTKPTISGKNTYTSNMSSPVTEATIRAGLTATDNHDTNLTVQLVNDGYTANKQKAGSYNLTYKAVDSSGNTSDIFTVTVTNKDDIKPIITGTNSFIVASTGTITSDYIISQLTVSDNIDKNLTIKLVNDGYTANKDKVGTYQMTFNVKDSSGNTSNTFTVNITVEDDIPPVFWVSNDFFSVDESLTLTHKQIIDVLLKMNDIDTTMVANYRVIEDEYTMFANKVGTYAVAYELQMINGEVIELSSEINVVGEEDFVPSEETEEKEDKGFMKKVFEDVKEFFVKIIKSIVKYIGLGFIWDKEGKFDPHWSSWN